MQPGTSRLISMAALIIIFAAICSAQEIVLPFLLAGSPEETGVK